MGTLKHAGDPRIRSINPDLLFVQNQVNRPRFGPGELEQIQDLQVLAETSVSDRPFLSPPELLLMTRAGIVPAHMRGLVRRKKGRRSK